MDPVLVPGPSWQGCRSCHQGARLAANRPQPQLAWPQVVLILPPGVPFISKVAHGLPLYPPNATRHPGSPNRCLLTRCSQDPQRAGSHHHHPNHPHTPSMLGHLGIQRLPRRPPCAPPRYHCCNTTPRRLHSSGQPCQILLARALPLPDGGRCRCLRCSRTQFRASRVVQPLRQTWWGSCGARETCWA